jgi:hypothetical protein
MENIEELYNFLDSNNIIGMYICDEVNSDLFLLQLFPDSITVCNRSNSHIYDISLESILIAINEERITFFTEEVIDMEV